MADNNVRQQMPPPGRGPGGPGGRHRHGGKIDFKTLKKEKDTVKRLLAYVWAPNKIRICIVLVSIILSSFAGTYGNLFLQTLLDDHVIPQIGAAHPVFGGLLKACVFMGCIYYVGVIANFLSARLMIAVSQRTMKKIRDEMFAKMQTLPVRFFDSNSYGNIMSHFTNDTDTLRQMISQSISQTVTSMVNIIVSLVSMLSLSPLLTVVTLFMVSFMIITTGKIGTLSSKRFVKLQADVANLNGYIEEMIEGQKVVKVFNYEEKAKDTFNDLNEELCDSASKAHILGGIMMPINMNLGNLSYLVVGLVGAALAIGGVGSLTIGTIVAFLTLSKQFNMPITTISQQLNSVIMALAGAKRIFTLIDQEPEPDEGDVGLVNVEEKDGKLVPAGSYSRTWAWAVPKANGEVEYVRLEGDVRLNGVTFGYVEGKTVLKDINLYAKPGQKVAFVGHTGAGKTTITNLLNRFYDVQQGTITYDGIDVMRIRKADLRRALGMVLQDTHLFTGTVMENIRYGRLDAPDEECIAAAKLANAHEFIMLLPDGYDTVLTGNGDGLSQGQRQLLNIARCAVADPPVMILDEATSSIDTRTEALVQDGMDALMTGRTVFVIAHRLSTVQNSDVIMVLDNGVIIERGDHDELIDQKGMYYKLYTGAFELE